MTLTINRAAAMTFDEFMEVVINSGFHFHRTDWPVISPATAQILLNLADDRLSTISVGEYDMPFVQELVNARDELQAASRKATEAS